MSMNESIIGRGTKVFTPNYKQQPLTLVRGEGCRVWDADGKEYIDLIGGVAVTALGHCHPAVVRALEEQARVLWHVSNHVYTPRAVELAEALIEGSLFAKRVFLCNSGAEANEAMMKLARKFHSDLGHPERNEIVTCVDSFHGRTLFAVTATGQEKFQRGFEPLVPGVRHIPFGDLAALEKALTPNTAAFMVEPIQGESGVRPAPEGYLAGARELTRKHGALLLLDEIQTGMGRTGKLWFHEWDGVAPDIMSVAKALANGYPMGAILASEEVGSHLTPGSHGSTFGGNALGCAVALATLKVIRGGALENARRVSDHLFERLGEMRSAGFVEEVRGRGMLIGIELANVSAPDVMVVAREHGLIVNGIGEKVLRLMPPLTMSMGEADEAIVRLNAALAAASRKG
jgi:acetylornithine/N-succinyldiaminopimelate aminotransferase